MASLYNILERHNHFTRRVAAVICIIPCVPASAISLAASVSPLANLKSYRASDTISVRPSSAPLSSHLAPEPCPKSITESTYSFGTHKLSTSHPAVAIRLTVHHSIEPTRHGRSHVRDRDVRRRDPCDRNRDHDIDSHLLERGTHTAHTRGRGRARRAYRGCCRKRLWD
jgi:hypothetical protein